MTGLARLIACVALCLSAATGWQASAMSATPASRNLSYSVAAPQGWVIIHETTFNGARIVPVQFSMDDWISLRPFGSGSSYAGSVPSMAGDIIEVRSRWIEWKTGKAFVATLKVPLPDAHGPLLLRFQRDGALSAYRRSDALLAGGLGRMSTEADFVEIGRICAEPVPDAEAADLMQARADNYGIDFATADPRPFPDADPSFCSGP